MKSRLGGTTYTDRLAIALGLLLTLFGARQAGAQLEAWVLTNNSLVLIDTANPSTAGTPVAITGLNPGETLVGIDFRPVNGYLYGLGVQRRHRHGAAITGRSPASRQGRSHSRRHQ